MTKDDVNVGDIVMMSKPIVSSVKIGNKLLRITQKPAQHSAVRAEFLSQHDAEEEQGIDGGFSNCHSGISSFWISPSMIKRVL